MVINAQAFNPTIWLNQLYIALILLLQFNLQTLFILSWQFKEARWRKEYVSKT